MYRRMAGPRAKLDGAENIAPTGIDHRTVQPVASIAEILHGFKFKH
jgi:hypothetical protein